jgi:hypothetical protein
MERAISIVNGIARRVIIRTWVTPTDDRSERDVRRNIYKKNECHKPIRSIIGWLTVPVYESTV